MSSIRLLFITNNLPVSVLLRVFTWSDWSHVAAIMEDGETAIDATMLHGVSQRPLSAVTKGSKYAIREYECARPDKFYAFLREQVGKPYDFSGVFGIGLHRNWQDPENWFCSEIQACGLAIGESPRFANDQWRVTPQNLWMAR